jgi:hypothetical protein
VEALWQHVHQEVVDELAGIECHHLEALGCIDAAIFPLEGDAVVVE